MVETGSPDLADSEELAWERSGPGGVGGKERIQVRKEEVIDQSALESVGVRKKDGRLADGSAGGNPPRGDGVQSLGLGKLATQRRRVLPQLYRWTGRASLQIER